MCESNQLSVEEARNLAFELSARVNDGAERPAYQIQQPRRWMETVVAQARSSQASILRVGTRYVEAERAAEQRAQAEEAATLAKAKQEQQAREDNAALELRLSGLSDEQRSRLHELALEAMPGEWARKHGAKIKASIEAHNLAGGLVGAAIRKAMEKLSAPASVEEDQ